MEGFTGASTPGRQVPGMASEISFGRMALEAFTGQSQAETLQKESPTLPSPLDPEEEEKLLDQQVNCEATLSLKTTRFPEKSGFPQKSTGGSGSCAFAVTVTGPPSEGGGTSAETGRSLQQEKKTATWAPAHALQSLMAAVLGPRLLTQNLKQFH